ncbi:MAG: 5'-deoxynucleotidase [Clostridia bacterium]|nr:5'-deoxynucleotidase [Clostridia bacterium]
MHNFFALLSRMKLIERWSLMRSTHKETLMEHSADVAILAQALAVIKNNKFGGSVNIDRVATIALYHDTSEVISGDLPTPIKYFNPKITSAYHEIEDEISKKLLTMLPEDMEQIYDGFLNPDRNSYEYKLVKIADKLAAYLKCVEEKSSGNHEFDVATDTTKEKLEALNCEELNYFLNNFLVGFGKPLDFLN